MNTSIQRDLDYIRFNFIMQSEFPVNALVLASEALRIANQNTGRQLFDWSFVSEDGQPVRASNGMWLGADCATTRMPPADVYLFFAGNLPTQCNSRQLLAPLRQAAREGAIVGGVDTGAFALVEAGLAGQRDSRNVILHWEAVSSFLEQFPDASANNQIFAIERGRAFCAGGIATLDMVLELVARFRGQTLANEIANALVHTRREMTTPQRSDSRFGKRSVSPLSRMIELMECNIEECLTLPELSRRLGVSDRTLSRICHRAFAQSPMKLYRNIRLRSARNLLFYSELSIREIGLACGFSHPSVFSRVFRKQFGKSPRAFRSEFRDIQNLNLRPELHRMVYLPVEPRSLSSSPGPNEPGHPPTWVPSNQCRT